MSHRTDAIDGIDPARPPFRRRALLLCVTAFALVLVSAGCGSTDRTGDPGATHTMPDGSVMSGSSMPGMQSTSGAMQMTGDGHRAGGPSETASMICGAEIREAVGHTLGLSTVPAGLHSWSHHLFQCTYQLPGGDLRLSVKDLTTEAPGTAYFQHLRRQLGDARTIKGVPSFGFPAFETRRGDVVFIKDHKTLRVDATRLRESALPAGQTREDVAYGVAAAVIACWTE